MAIILEGKAKLNSFKSKLKLERKKYRSKIILASIRVGKDAATDSYIGAQERWADELNIEHKVIDFGKSVSQSVVINKIKLLNKNKSVKGIILHTPLPAGWKAQAIFESIAKDKDIEGMTQNNLGAIMIGGASFIPPTVLSVLEFLKLSKIKLYGKNVVIVGFSAIFGKPLSVILADQLATVSLTHIGTSHAGKLGSFLKEADIVISAVGKPSFIKGAWIKKGAVVIDVGISKLGGRICGDIDFKSVIKKASFITPVPGGVGSLTTYFLFENLIKAALKKKS